MSIWIVPPLRPFPQHGMSSFGRGREHQFILASSGPAATGPAAKPTTFAHLQLSQPNSQTSTPSGCFKQVRLGGRAEITCWWGIRAAPVAMVPLPALRRFATRPRFRITTRPDGRSKQSISRPRIYLWQDSKRIR